MITFFFFLLFTLFGNIYAYSKSNFKAKSKKVLKNFKKLDFYSFLISKKNDPVPTQRRQNS